MCIVGRSSLASIVIVVCYAARVAAEPPAGSPPAVQLLNTFWNASTGNYKAAQEQYDQARLDAPNDVRIPYAMALIAVRNHHLPEADKFLDAGLSRGKPLLPIRRARIWLDARLNDKVAVQNDIREFAHILSADEASANRADYQDSAHWLGAVIGYYSGPAKYQLKPADLTSLDAELSSTLKGPLATQFADGKTAVEKKFAELQNELTTALAQTKLANETKRADDRQKNDAALAEATSSRTHAEQELDRYRQEKNADAVENEFNRLNNQLTVLNAQQSRLESWKPDAESGKPFDPKNQRIEREKEENSRALDQLKSAIDAVKGRLEDVRKSVQEIRAHCLPLANEARSSRILETKFTNLKRQLDHPAPANDSATIALDGKVKSINTYAGIDLDEEKARILATYGTK